VLDNVLKKIFGEHIFSKQTAKNRLQMVLVQDRSGLSSQDMDDFRKDLLDVIVKYFDLKHKEIDIQWSRKDGSTALVVNTPVMVKKKKKQATIAVAAK
jgi:cell division topological specificity factor